MSEGKTLEVFDVGTETAVCLAWPAEANREPVVRFQPAGGRALTLPASVVQLAAALLKDPSLLTVADRA